MDQNFSPNQTARGPLIEVIECTRQDVDITAKLFNFYRMFYELPDDLDKSRDYHRFNVQQERSRIFLEVNDDKDA
ncbi:hypothetical protein [Pseudomonas sp. NFR16]|uniref:hypothetical protein n=1 Tax=Pseudomonas sp. NFR16 TaxID=1566248 RepID=UPI0008C91DFE|nr:hypothetical protein [Pseudomonas sp. NFR16]SEJ77818.1 hypothetical protein SAMN03159495_4485 [Pseudomonas sp. NFR16]